MSSTDSYTISVHHGSSHISMAHNNRELSVVSKESHIGLGGDFESFVHIPVNQAYKAMFDEARLEYNAKQTRSDREIQDYLQKIKKDKKKALEEQSRRIEELEDKLDRILDFVQTVHDVLKTTAFSIFKKFESKFNEFLSPTKEHRTEKTRDKQDLFIR